VFLSVLVFVLAMRHALTCKLATYMIYHDFQKRSVVLYTVVSYHELLDRVSELLDNMLRKLPRERDYNAVFGRIAGVLMQEYSLTIPALDLRFRFTLFMQEEFDSIPKERWKLNDPEWLHEKEQAAKTKLVSWIQEQIKESEGSNEV